MQQNHQWNDCFNFRILRRVCIKGGRGGGGGNTWTILSWSMIWSCLLVCFCYFFCLCVCLLLFFLFYFGFCLICFVLFCVLVVVVFVSNSKVKQEKTKGNFVTSANDLFILIFDLFDLV